MVLRHHNAKQPHSVLHNHFMDAACCVQVASLDMLARVYVEHDKWEEAAAVYNALASRTSNYNEPSVNLNTRLDLFRMAKLQVTGLRHPPDFT